LTIFTIIDIINDMDFCVNDINNMSGKKISKSLEESVSIQFESLRQTAMFLNSQVAKKQSELQFLNKKLETDWEDSTYERFLNCIEELKNLEKKVNWEKKQCQEFDGRIEKLNTLKSNEFISDLSKKILSKRRKN